MLKVEKKTENSAWHLSDSIYKQAHKFLQSLSWKPDEGNTQEIKQKHTSLLSRKHDSLMYVYMYTHSSQHRSLPKFVNKKKKSWMKHNRLKIKKKLTEFPQSELHAS